MPTWTTFPCMVPFGSSCNSLGHCVTPTALACVWPFSAANVSSGQDTITRAYYAITSRACRPRDPMTMFASARSLRLETISKFGAVVIADFAAPAIVRPLKSAPQTLRVALRRKGDNLHFRDRIGVPLMGRQRRRSGESRPPALLRVAGRGLGGEGARSPLSGRP